MAGRPSFGTFLKEEIAQFDICTERWLQRSSLEVLQYSNKHHMNRHLSNHNNGVQPL